MSQYARGRRKEYAAKALLEQDGYWVTRSASSKGLWDLTAVSAKEVLLVQTKLTSKPGKSWRDANLKRFEELAVPANVRKEAWVYRAGVGTPERYALGGVA